MGIVFCYIWLPFMILPVYAALERIPDSFIEASADLGARNARTLRSVVLPLALPGVVAGSIFTFSLTLGDYITPLLIGSGSGTNLIGNVIYDNIGLAQRPPFCRRPRHGTNRDHDRLPSRGVRALGAFEAM